MPLIQAPEFTDIQAAASRLAPFIVRTPIVPSPWLSDLLRSDVWLKLEMLQSTGSFKLRGALNAMMQLDASSAEHRTVVTASAGNHGVAVAWAASRFGQKVRVYLPASAPLAKRSALQRLGADLIDAPTYEIAEARARADAAATGDVYLSPYDHHDVIAGAGTIAVEMLADQPDLDAIVAPLGGGGLLSGTGIAARAMAVRLGRMPPVIIGAEAEASPAFTAALAAGRVAEIDVRETLADGLAGNMDPDSGTLTLVRDYADRVALVAEDSIRIAMRGLLRHEHLIVEGASATPVGALMQGGLDLAGRKIGVILTGRNVDPSVISSLVSPA